MQLNEQYFMVSGIRLIPSETPNRRLITGPKTISLNRKPDMEAICAKVQIWRLNEPCKFNSPEPIVTSAIF
jgi:hypothetical protein